MLPKWTHAAFSYVLDTARVNAGTIFNVKNEATLDSFELGWDLAESLLLHTCPAEEHKWSLQKDHAEDVHHAAKRTRPG